jgi:ankyrin repeat protein
MRTTLHLAVAERQTEVVKVLLKRNARTDVVDRWGKTPLLEALSTGCLAEAEMLIARGARLESNNFALVREASEVDSAQLSLMCLKANVSPDSCDYDTRSVLHCQCLAGNLKAVEALLSVGANVNVTDR